MMPQSELETEFKLLGQNQTELVFLGCKSPPVLPLVTITSCKQRQCRDQFIISGIPRIGISACSERNFIAKFMQ